MLGLDYRTAALTMLFLAFFFGADLLKYLLGANNMYADDDEADEIRYEEIERLRMKRDNEACGYVADDESAEND